MTNNVYGIDLGTCNMKIYCKASNKIMNEKNTIALVNKNEMYAYGDDAYAMYEKAPETIQVTFPVVGGVIADFNNLQVMLQTYLETHAKGKLRGAEFIVAVPTDITDVEKRAFFDMFYKSKLIDCNVHYMRKYSCSQHQCQKPYERDRKIISTYSHQLALILSLNLRIDQKKEGSLRDSVSGCRGFCIGQALQGDQKKPSAVRRRPGGQGH